MAGDDVLLHYAIADVAWFVQPGDPLDTEAWQRGATQYLPDGKAGLTRRCSPRARQACCPTGRVRRWCSHVRVDADGQVEARRRRAFADPQQGQARPTRRSRPAQLPDAFAELARRIAAAEEARGAAASSRSSRRFARRRRRRLRHLVPAAVEVGGRQRGACRWRPTWRSPTRCTPRGTGLFRVMPEPDARAEQRLRHTARALGIELAGGHGPARLRAVARRPGAEARGVADGDPPRRRRRVVRPVLGRAATVALRRWPPRTAMPLRRCAASPIATW